VLENMRGVLKAAGGDLTYMTKIEDRPAVAAARDEVFP